MIVMDDMTFYSTMGTVAMLCLFVGLLPFFMAKPVIVPYLRASFGSRYAAFVLDKTNRFRIEPAKLQNGVITVPGFKNMSWVKFGDKGSYTLGNCRCDILLDCASIADEADYSAVIEELERVGVPDLRTLTLQMNIIHAERAGITLNRYNLRRISDIVEEYPDLNFEIIYPLIGRMDVRTLANWCESTPQVVASNIAEGVSIEADDVKTDNKPLSTKDIVPWIILAFAGVIVALIAVKGMGML